MHSALLARVLVNETHVYMITKTVKGVTLFQSQKYVAISKGKCQFKDKIQACQF